MLERIAVEFGCCDCCRDITPLWTWGSCVRHNSEAADSYLYCIRALFFKSPNHQLAFDSLTAHTTLYGARAVKLALAGELHSEDCQLLMHESFLRGALWNNAKHEKLSPARWSLLEAEALMHVGVNLSRGWLDETQEVGAGSGSGSVLCKRCCVLWHAGTQTYIPLMSGMQTWENTYYLMYESNVHTYTLCKQDHVSNWFVLHLSSPLNKKNISLWDFMGTFKVSPPPQAFVCFITHLLWREEAAGAEKLDLVFYTRAVYSRSRHGGCKVSCVGNRQG